MDAETSALEHLKLEQSWLEATRTTLNVRPTDDYLQLTFAENSNIGDSINVFRQFTLLVEKGITPPVNLLTSLATGFRRYLDAKPKVSLDAAFNLKSKQRVGHALDHRLAIEERGQIIHYMWFLRHQAKLKNESLSILNAAGEAITKFNLTLDESVLEKNYVDMKAGDIFDNCYEVLDKVLKSRNKTRF